MITADAKSQPTELEYQQEKVEKLQFRSSGLPIYKIGLAGPEINEIIYKGPIPQSEQTRTKRNAPKGENVFLLEQTPFLKGPGVKETKQEVTEAMLLCKNGKNSTML